MSARGPLHELQLTNYIDAAVVSILLHRELWRAKADIYLFQFWSARQPSFLLLRWNAGIYTYASVDMTWLITSKP